MSKLQKVVDAFLASGLNVKRYGPDQYQAQCPLGQNHNNNDKKPSLSIGLGRDKVLLTCHKCGTSAYDDIVTALGLEKSDLYFEELSKNGTGKKVLSDEFLRLLKEKFPKLNDDLPKAECDILAGSWDYYDESGELLYRVCRYEDEAHTDKTFEAERWDSEAGKFKRGTKDVKKILYRQKELSVADDDTIIFICEGEAHSDLVTQLGEDAFQKWLGVTNAFGAKSWKSDFNQWFQNRPVVIMQDNDNAGAERTDLLIKNLVGVAQSIKVIVFDDLGPKADVIDWHKQNPEGHDGHKLLDIINSTPYWRPVNMMGNPFNVMTGDELFSLPPKDWLVEGVMGSRDLVMIFGRENVGKTFAAIDLMMSLALGKGKWADNFKQTRPANSIYLTDEGTDDVPARFRAALMKYGQTSMPNSLRVGFQVPQLFDDKGFELNWQLLLDYLAADPYWKPDIIFLDTLFNCSVGARENVSDDATIVIKHLKAIRDALDVAIVLLHHSDKNANWPRGTGAYMGSCDCILRVEEGKMTCFKQKSAKKFGAIGFKLDQPTGCESVNVTWGKVIQLNDESTDADILLEHLKDKRDRQFTTSELSGVLIDVLGLDANGRQAENRTRQAMNWLDKNNRNIKKTKTKPFRWYYESINDSVQRVLGGDKKKDKK